MRLSVQGVKSLVGHFACFCREFGFYEVEKNISLFFSNLYRRTPRGPRGVKKFPKYATNKSVEFLAFWFTKH